MNRKTFDYPLFIVTIALVGFGLVMIFSASFYLSDIRMGDSTFFFTRQLTWAAIGFVGMMFFATYDYKKLRKFSVPILLVSIGLLIIVLSFGVQRNFATRWIEVLGISIQPSEIARFAMILFLADSIAKRRDKIKFFFKGVLPYLFLLTIVFGLILLQPNFSMAGSLAILVMVILYIGGMRFWHLLLVSIAGAVSAWKILQSANYRIDRLTAFLDPWADPLDTGYQLIQSFFALGAGGVLGVGFGQSRQKHLFLPHSETDFILSIIGEEWGFLGTTVLLVTFLFLIFRGVRIAIAAPDFFGSLLSAGIIGLIAIQVLIHIAVVTGTMPPTGLPLPFVSFGGSSLVMFMSSMGILLNVSRYT